MSATQSGQSVELNIQCPIWAGGIRQKYSTIIRN